MSSDAKKPQPEREQTDESLRTERKNTDHVLGERRTRVEETADGIVERAREQADAVLDTARDKADGKLDVAKAGPQARDAVARERAVEDETLRDERSTADESLRREREEQARTLAELLPLEREKTDRYLLTERTRSDDAVAHRDDFMGIISHDLRNLLGAIAGNVRLVAKQASVTDEGRRTVAGMERIQRYVARMNRLIGDLVDVVSIDAGKLAVHAQPADAAELIREAVDAFAHAAEEKGLTLEFESSDPVLPAIFDRERMLQVLANLITNAIKFTASGGAITVRAERTRDELRVSVVDTGQGIAEDMLEAVFERFWQVGKNDHRGLGLGLYISKCIVAAHDGRIWAESKPGAGSAFHFSIPVTGGRSS
jgi:signal transduction histidine kinase